MHAATARAVAIGLAALTAGAMCGCAVPDPASEARQRALWRVSDGMTKAEVVRLGGPPAQISKPNRACEHVSGVKEQIVYQFEVEYRLLGRYPSSGLYFCLDEAETVVGCCGFIEY